VEQTRAEDDWQHVLFVSSDISDIFQVGMIVVADESFRTQSSLWDEERRESQGAGFIFYDDDDARSAHIGWTPCWHSTISHFLASMDRTGQCDDVKFQRLAS